MEYHAYVFFGVFAAGKSINPTLNEVVTHSAFQTVHLFLATLVVLTLLFTSQVPSMKT